MCISDVMLSAILAKSDVAFFWSSHISPIVITWVRVWERNNYLCILGAQDGGMWNGRVRVGSAENENLEKLKLESSLGEVTER